MIFTSPLRRLLFVCATVAGCVCQVAEATSCVWKATSPSGGTVFLAGSVHALRGSDYPLPAAYQRAFDSSSRLAFETEPKSMEAASKGLNKAGQYGKGDSLKNHVDPRTYAYLKRYFTLLGVPEQKFSTYRPWLIAAMLEAAPKQNFNLGVERFLQNKAASARKPIESLESIQEHMAPFVDLTERESEALHQSRPNRSRFTRFDRRLAARRCRFARADDGGRLSGISRFRRPGSRPPEPALDSKDRWLCEKRPGVFCHCRGGPLRWERRRSRVTAEPRLHRRAVVTPRRARFWPNEQSD
jgi:hypothetical protein